MGLLRADPAYRFTYLPTFHAPRFVAVHVDAGRPVIEGVVLGGAGGYEPGEVVKRTRRVLTSPEWRLLRQRLRNAGMWGHIENSTTSGVDGSSWVLEGRQNGKYRLYNVFSPDPEEMPRYFKACTYMLDLAGVRPPAENLY